MANVISGPCSLSPVNAEAAQLYRENLKEYVRRVKATVEESWIDAEDEEEMDEEDEDAGESTLGP